jgi:hypothetical protein
MWSVQIVGFGVHPTTGQPYRWLSGDPTGMAFDTLPVVTKAELDAFLQAAEVVIRAAGGRPDKAIKAEKAAREAADKGAETNNQPGPDAEAKDKKTSRGPSGRRRIPRSSRASQAIQAAASGGP